jgi:hypothetical protein
MVNDCEYLILHLSMRRSQGVNMKVWSLNEISQHILPPDVQMTYH